jgi:hypothetical protein
MTVMAASMQRVRSTWATISKRWTQICSSRMLRSTLTQVGGRTLHGSNLEPWTSTRQIYIVGMCSHVCERDFMYHSAHVAMLQFKGHDWVGDGSIWCSWAPGHKQQ